MSREELYTSDELFLTGTAAGVIPIREVDGRIIGSEEWPITKRLRESYREIVHGKNLRYANWLDPIRESKPLSPVSPRVRK